MRSGLERLVIHDGTKVEAWRSHVEQRRGDLPADLSDQGAVRGGRRFVPHILGLDSARPLDVCDSRLSCEWLVRCICKERSITVFPLVFPSIFSSNC